jgi:outer membrane protein assembly factor BamB
VDISLEPTEEANQFIVWMKDIAPYNPNTRVYGDFLYVLYDRGLFACYDARTGKEIYDKQRIPNGGGFTASPWAYDGKIFCLNEDGVTFAIEAGPEFKIVAENRLGEDDMSLATPAIAGEKLLIRTASRMYCIENAQ